MDQYYQQGDVIIECLNKTEDEAKKYLQYKNTDKLAEGEATGHAHRVQSTDYAIYGTPTAQTWGRDLILIIRETSVITHEEHKPITLPAGVYRIRQVSEYDHLNQRQRYVAD